MAREATLYEMPKTLERARVLDDSVLNEYNESAKTAYNSEQARNTLLRFGKSGGELTGSTPFMLVHLQNSGLIDGRIATRQDLETALKFGLNLSGNYTDFGLALRTAGDSHSPNDLLAGTLAEQLAQRGIKLGKGKFIPISALKLRESDNSQYGLVLDLNDVAEVEDLSKQKWDYSRKEGLARACLDGNGSWYSGDEGLADSNGCGRVVVVSGEATAKNFLNSRVAKLQNQRDAEIALIAKRYAQAERVLLGK